MADIEAVREAAVREYNEKFVMKERLMPKHNEDQERAELIRQLHIRLAEERNPNVIMEIMPMVEQLLNEKQLLENFGLMCYMRHKRQGATAMFKDFDFSAMYMIFYCHELDIICNVVTTDDDQKKKRDSTVWYRAYTIAKDQSTDDKKDDETTEKTHAAYSNI